MLTRSIIRHFREAREGIAAIEFALVLPLLTLTALAIFELTLRFQIADELERYTFQAGDILSRAANLSEADIDDIYGLAPHIMPGVDLDNATFSVTVSSIGYQTDGSPVLLWTRSRGDGTVPVQLERTRGLAPPGQSIIISQTSLNAPTLFAVFADTAFIETGGTAMFKPRTTRAIAMNGDLSEAEYEIEGYEDE